MCLNHFALIEVCSVDILATCLRISTGLKGDFSMRDASMRALSSERLNRSHNVSQNLNVSSAYLKFEGKYEDLERSEEEKKRTLLRCTFFGPFLLSTPEKKVENKRKVSYGSV